MALRMLEVVVSAASLPVYPESTASAAGSGAEETPSVAAGPLGLTTQTLIDAWQEPLAAGLVRWRLLCLSDGLDVVLHELEERFGHDPRFRIVVMEVQATMPRPVEQVSSADAQEESGRTAAVVEPSGDRDDDSNSDRPGADETAKPDPQRIACIELVEQVAAHARLDRVYLLSVTLATLVAAVGLMRDNVAVIIGAMVIAPLLGPNMTLSVATALGDGDMARRAVRVNGAGFVLALGLSIVFGVALPVDPATPEIASRTAVALSDVILALAAGSAGALAITTGLSSAVVGVMVAVALLPPLVAMGLLLGAGEWQLALGALLLTATNVICVNLAGVATFLWRGVQPRLWWQAARARRLAGRAVIVWCLLLVVLIGLIMISAE